MIATAEMAMLKYAREYKLDRARDAQIRGKVQNINNWIKRRNNVTRMYTDRIINLARGCQVRGRRSVGKTVW